MGQKYVHDDKENFVQGVGASRLTQAQDILKEKNWRFGYRKHIENVVSDGK